MFNQTLPSPCHSFAYFRNLNDGILGARTGEQQESMAQQLRACCSRRELGFVTVYQRVVAEFYGLW